MPPFAQSAYRILARCLSFRCSRATGFAHDVRLCYAPSRQKPSVFRSPSCSLTEAETKALFRSFPDHHATLERLGR